MITTNIFSNSKFVIINIVDQKYFRPELNVIIFSEDFPPIEIRKTFNIESDNVL